MNLFVIFHYAWNQSFRTTGQENNAYLALCYTLYTIWWVYVVDNIMLSHSTLYMCSIMYAGELEFDLDLQAVYTRIRSKI